MWRSRPLRRLSVYVSRTGSAGTAGPAGSPDHPVTLSQTDISPGSSWCCCRASLTTVLSSALSKFGPRVKTFPLVIHLCNCVKVLFIYEHPAFAQRAPWLSPGVVDPSVYTVNLFNVNLNLAAVDAMQGRVRW